MGERYRNSCGTKVIPLTGASDCRYFSRVSRSCFRFSPFAISKEQLASIHGIDENITISGIHRAVDFYKYIIKEI
jgi:carboxypeptidase PM20D1